MNSLERISMLKNSWWLFFDKIIRQGLNFLLTAYIARYLGAAEFGQWNYAIAFVALFSFFSTFGLYNILLRDFVRSEEKAGEIMGSALLLKFLGGCLTLLFSVLCILILKPNATILHILIFVTAAGYIAQSADVLDYYFQSQLKSSWIASARGISFFIFGSILVSNLYIRTQTKSYNTPKLYKNENNCIYRSINKVFLQK